MKADIDIKKLHKGEVETQGLKTSIKEDNKKSTKEMADLHIEDKARYKLFKWEWKL
tara:strand:+ start:198 stop:365 length:168 start_codon:yes stop_codon:yes gene_type:complete